MSQNYKIVERLQREAELKRAAAMDCYGDRRDTLNREAAEDDQAASLILELGEALSDAQEFVGGMAGTFEREGFPEEMDAEERALILGLRAKIDAILSSLAESRSGEGWQPIETATKEYKDVLTWDGVSVRLATHAWEDKWQSEGMTAHKPTHWMPVPLPPCSRLSTGGVTSPDYVIGLTPHSTAVSAALRAQVIEECAKVAESIKVVEGEPSPELLHEMENDVLIACEAAGNITARRIAKAIRSLSSVSAIAQERDVGEPVAWLRWNSYFHASPHGQDAEGTEALELCEPVDRNAFPVYRQPTTSPSAISEAPCAEAVKTSPEVGEMVESLKTQAIWVTAYADGDDTSIPPTLEAACSSIARVSREAASLLIALDAEIARLREALEERFEQYRNARDALFEFNNPPDPKLLREIANEIDCGNDCEHGHTEWDTNAHVCSRSDRKEGCAGSKAWCLRQFADAVDIRSALPASDEG